MKRTRGRDRSVQEQRAKLRVELYNGQTLRMFMAPSIIVAGASLVIDPEQFSSSWSAFLIGWSVIAMSMITTALNQYTLTIILKGLPDD